MSTSTPKPSRWRPWLLLAVATSLFLVVAITVAYRAKTSGIRAIEQAFADRGLGVSLGSSRLSLRANVVVDTLCVSLADDDHHDVCADRVAIGLNRRALLRRNVEVRSVAIRALTIDTATDRLERFFEKQGEEDSADEPRSSRLDALRNLTIDATHVALQHDETTMHGRLDNVALNHAPSGDDATAWTLAYDAILERFETTNVSLARVFEGIAHTALHVEATANRARDLQHVQARFAAPITVHTHVKTPSTIRLQQLRFEAPYAILLDRPAAVFADIGVAADATTVRLDVGHWTTRLRDLYIATATADTPTIYATDASVADIVQRAKDALRATPAPQGEHDDQTPRSALSDEVAQRRWWEVLPREITLHDGRIAQVDTLPVLTDDGIDASATIVHSNVRALDMHYGIRVIQRQMDLELSAELFRGTAPSGSLRAKFEFEYDKNRAHLDAGVSDVPLGWLIGQWSRSFADAEGTVQAGIQLHGSTARGFEATTAVTLSDVVLPHAKLQEPLRFSSLTSEATLTLNERDDGWALSMPSHVVRVGDAELHPRLELIGLRSKPPHLAQRAIIRLHVPEQDAMVLFRAIPASLRGPVADAHMRGQWGILLDFAIEARGVDAQGRPLWEILSPTTSTLLDQSLALIDLPEAVDVRRMNGPMQLVFRGPNDSMMRPITIPAPQNLRQYPTVSNRSGDEANSRWVRLNDMSYYVVATQLYREDGSFFRNTGINWLQLRRVLSEALTTGTLSRGASTITMQTVKNLFLSHERSIERKLQELFLSYWMTRAVPKERILEIYMNIIELGPNINGVEEASQFYFRQPISTLGLRDSVWLSSLSPSPVRLGGGTYKGPIAPGSCVRCDRLIDGLLARKWISAEEHRVGIGQPLDEHEAAPGALPVELPPLFAAIEEGTAAKAVDRLPTDERIAWWVHQSIVPRGTSAQR